MEAFLEQLYLPMYHSVCTHLFIPLYSCNNKNKPFPYSHFKTHTAVQSDISCNNQTNSPANSYTHICASVL